MSKWLSHPKPLSSYAHRSHLSAKLAVPLSVNFELFSSSFAGQSVADLFTVHELSHSQEISSDSDGRVATVSLAALHIATACSDGSLSKLRDYMIRLACQPCSAAQF